MRYFELIAKTLVHLRKTFCHLIVLPQTQLGQRGDHGVEVERTNQAIAISREKSHQDNTHPIESFRSKNKYEDEYEFCTREAWYSAFGLVFAFT